MDGETTFGKRGVRKASVPIAAAPTNRDQPTPERPPAGEQTVLRSNRLVLVIQNLAFTGLVFASGFVTHADWRSLPGALARGQLPGAPFLLPGVLLLVLEVFTLWQWLQPFVLKMDDGGFQYMNPFGETRGESWDHVRDIIRARRGKYRYIRVEFWGGNNMSIHGCAGHTLAGIIELMHRHRARHSPVSAAVSNQGFDRKHLFGGR